MKGPKPNVFEKIVLAIGVAIILFGYALVHRTVALEGFNTETIQMIFLWLILVTMIILLAVNENIKEELKQVIEMQLNEVREFRRDIKRR